MPLIPEHNCAVCRKVIPEGVPRRTCSDKCFEQYSHNRRRDGALDSYSLTLQEKLQNNSRSFIVTGSCSLWLGAMTSPQGYGSIRHNGKTLLAHRAAYQIYLGPIPDDGEVLHSCDTPLCITPDHLFVATKKERGRFMVERGNHPLMRYDIGPEKVKELRQRWMAGERLKDLASEVDMKDRSLSYILKGNRTGDPPLREEEREFFSRKRSPCRKVLTDEQVQEAQRRNEAGESIASLAREFGVCRDTMTSAVKGRGAYDWIGDTT